jgi:hypothetical protein
VTEPPAPFAAGVHLPWAQVPEPVQQWATALGGARPLHAVDLEGGFSPGAAARLTFATGDVFVKAVGLSLNPDSPGLHRREGLIAAALPSSPLYPRLLDTYDDGDWVALAFEAIDGRHPRQPWHPEELDQVMGGLSAMHDALTPTPDASIEASATHMASLFNGWQLLASAGRVSLGLDEWSRRHLSRLAKLESAWPAACAGETLVHGDIRSDNLLLHSGGVSFVDWPHASVGTPVLDLVEWAPSVVLEGGPEPEALLARHEPSRTCDPEVITVLLAAVTGYLVQRSLLPSPPGLPTLRAFQVAQGEVARAWLQRRTGW